MEYQSNSNHSSEAFTVGFQTFRHIYQANENDVKVVQEADTSLGSGRVICVLERVAILPRVLHAPVLG